MNDDRFKEYCERASNGERILTCFLDEAEQSHLHRMIHSPLKVSFYGGYNEAERCRALICNAEEIKTATNFALSIWEIVYPTRFMRPNHRQILGTLMSLGINRTVIGDIVIGQGDSPQVWLVCSTSIDRYLQANLTSFNQFPIQLVSVTDSQLLEQQIAAITKRFLVASMRLDVIIASVLNMSRNATSEVIREGRVFVNHIQVSSDSKELHLGDLISIRKYGRIRLLRDVGKSKKDKIILEIEIKH